MGRNNKVWNTNRASKETTTNYKRASTGKLKDNQSEDNNGTVEREDEESLVILAEIWKEKGKPSPKIAWGALTLIHQGLTETNVGSRKKRIEIRRKMGSKVRAETALEMKGSAADY